MKYKVLLRGGNFQASIDGRTSRYGFFTTRFVEAETPAAAGQLAEELVREDPHLQAVVRNAPTDPPTIHLESLWEMESFGDVVVPGAGYSWFSEEEAGPAR